MQIDSYSYTTANDVTDRDPISWKLLGSNNGTDWTELDERINESITTNRNTETSIYTL